MPLRQPVVAVKIPASLPNPAPAPHIAPLSVMGVGRWPRPVWLLDALHRHLEGRLDDASFEATADDAVRLCVDAQFKAGVDVLTDGEQRRDNYSSFVGGLLDNCRRPHSDHRPVALRRRSDRVRARVRALDVPAGKVRHPAVFGPLGRSRPIALGEARFLHSLSDLPRKIALPGPYLLTRTMWMECVSDRAYADREALARDVVRVLREELADLLAEGVALVQFDEPVLSEVVFGHAQHNRTFMCGALGEKLDTPVELAFAEKLLAELTAGFPPERIALHVCRGNWSARRERRAARRLSPAAAAALARTGRDVVPRDVHAACGRWRVARGDPAHQAHRSRRREPEAPRGRDTGRDRRAAGSLGRACSGPSACCSIPTAASPRSPTTRWRPRRSRRPSLPRSRGPPRSCASAFSLAESACGAFSRNSGPPGGVASANPRPARARLGRRSGAVPPPRLAGPR